MRQGVEADPGGWPMSGEKGNPRFFEITIEQLHLPVMALV